jgi:2-iminobutanoate/2-iminopropanoate deaminase
LPDGRLSRTVRRVAVEIVDAQGIAEPLGHLSNVVRSGNRLYLAGLVALDESGAVVGESSIREQTLYVCRSIQAICSQHGANLGAVARCLVFISDRAGYAEYDAAFAEAFGGHKPARATVIAEPVNPAFLVEIVADVELG